MMRFILSKQYARYVWLPHSSKASRESKRCTKFGSAAALPATMTGSCTFARKYLNSEYVKTFPSNMKCGPPSSAGGGRYDFSLISSDVGGRYKSGFNIFSVLCALIIFYFIFFGTWRLSPFGPIAHFGGFSYGIVRFTIPLDLSRQKTDVQK